MLALVVALVCCFLSGVVDKNLFLLTTVDLLTLVSDVDDVEMDVLVRVCSISDFWFKGFLMFVPVSPFEELAHADMVLDVSEFDSSDLAEECARNDASDLPLLIVFKCDNAVRLVKWCFCVGDFETVFLKTLLALVLVAVV